MTNTETRTESSTPAARGVLATIRATPATVRFLLAGVLINQLGAFVQTFLVLFLVHRGLSAGQAGIALTAYSVGTIAGTLLGGETAHRFGPRATIVAAMTGSALFVAAVPALSTPGRFGLLLATTACAGLATQAYRPAASVLLSELMPEAHRVMGFSMMRIAMNTGAALSPLIAAALVTVDWNLLYWFDAATSLSYAGLAAVLLPSLKPAAAQPKQPSERNGYRIVATDGKYWLFLLSVLLGTVIYVQYTVALPLKIIADGHPEALYSAVLITTSLVLILFELKITSYVQHWPSYRAGALGTAVMALGAAGYALATHSTALLLLCTVVFVFGIMINGPSMFAHPATYPAGVRARYLAVHQAVFGVGMAAGPVFGVLAWHGLGNGVWPLCGGLGAVAAAAAWAGMRGV